jgi:hypothetical protein
MINSAEVTLGISILYAEVGHTNIFLFRFKNHLLRSSINTQQFIIKDILSKFVQILVQSLHMPSIITHPKLSFRSNLFFELQQK